MTDTTKTERDRAVEDALTTALCKSRKFETGQGTCAAICMDQLGDVRAKGCGHCARVHGKLAKSMAVAVTAIYAAEAKRADELEAENKRLAARDPQCQQDGCQYPDVELLHRNVATLTARVEKLEAALRDAANIRAYTRDDVQTLIVRLGADDWEQARKIASANAREALKPAALAATETEGK